MKTRIMKTKRGSVLVLAVIMVVILLIIGLALITLGQNARLQAIHSQLIVEARTAGDAGLTHAIKAMRTKLANEYIWNNSILPAQTNFVLPVSPSTSGAPAAFTYTVTGNQLTGWDIASTGTASGTQRTVHCKLIVGSLLVGIGVKEDITVKSGVQFATSPDSNVPIKIQTNSINVGKIGLYPNTIIPGDVVCGPGGNPDDVIDNKPNVTITGDAYAAEAPLQFTPVTVPPELIALPKASYTFSSDPNISGDKHYGDVKITGTQNITGSKTRIFVDGNITLSNGATPAELIIKPGASLELYLNGYMETKNSGGLDNQTGDSLNFWIFGTDKCTSIGLKANSTSLA
ncbi:MAG: hypothetical protein Q7T74_06555, partial [Candidatus Saccharibacteria bacterium]|nr:hypothetical protein [Candidatus Saccharibacteria bacterium]